MRCGSISEAMYDIRELFAWTSSYGYTIKSEALKKQYQYLSSIIGGPPIDLFLETIRNLCYSVFLVFSFTFSYFLLFFSSFEINKFKIIFIFLDNK